MDEYIDTVADAKNNIGKVLYWDDVSNRYVFLRSGKLEAVERGNLLINGDYKSRRDLPGLRNFKEGGAYARGIKT